MAAEDAAEPAQMSWATEPPTEPTESCDSLTRDSGMPTETITTQATRNGSATATSADTQPSYCGPNPSSSDAKWQTNGSEVAPNPESKSSSKIKSPMKVVYEEENGSASRKSSVGSVVFRLPSTPGLPQGRARGTNAQRLRRSSPDTVRFKRHVGFDNLPLGEATKKNTASLTLNAKHDGYHPRRRSRTFLVGVDAQTYSDYALVWLLNNLVDDGDEVVCVRVIESPSRTGADYFKEAQNLLRDTQEKNRQNKAISIVIEYAVGKLHDTFQQLIQLYQPSMLIVGTKGRSLGGIQGLMSTRNSFSKYCLQYSPVPVIVVRPDDMRQKKKDKRLSAPGRQTYTQILAPNGGKHETDAEGSSVYELEKVLPPDEEAHLIAAAIGLPAAFDPTIKPYKGALGAVRRSSPSEPAATQPIESNSQAGPPLADVNESGEEESAGEDEDEYEVEAVSADPLAEDGNNHEELRKQKQRLHAMEVGEAKALLKSGTIGHRNGGDDEEEEEEDEDLQEVSNGAK